MVTARPNGFIEPCIPTRAVKPPAGSDWVHEIQARQVHAAGLPRRRHRAAVRLLNRPLTQGPVRLLHQPDDGAAQFCSFAVLHIR